MLGPPDPGAATGLGLALTLRSPGRATLPGVSWTAPVSNRSNSGSLRNMPANTRVSYPPCEMFRKCFQNVAPALPFGKGHPQRETRLIGWSVTGHRLRRVACENGPASRWSPFSGFGSIPRSRQCWLTVGMECARRSTNRIASA
ncbi:hypothetical protein L209DRAFT_182965 [Thermothelomyces heterothallicus CBS 203.75]